MENDDLDALLHLIAAGGATAPRKALLESAPTPAAALAAGSARWRDCELSDAQVAALRAPDAAKLAHARHWLLRARPPPDRLDRCRLPAATQAQSESAIGPVCRRRSDAAVASIRRRSRQSCADAGRARQRRGVRAVARRCRVWASPAGSPPASIRRPTKPHSPWKAPPSPCSAPARTSPTRAAIPRCTRASPRQARWSASTCPAPARDRSTFPAAIASSPGWRWARW